MWGRLICWITGFHQDVLEPREPGQPSMLLCARCTRRDYLTPPR